MKHNIDKITRIKAEIHNLRQRRQGILQEKFILRAIRAGLRKYFTIS